MSTLKTAADPTVPRQPRRDARRCSPRTRSSSARRAAAADRATSSATGQRGQAHWPASASSCCSTRRAVPRAVAARGLGHAVPRRRQHRHRHRRRVGRRVRGHRPRPHGAGRDDEPLHARRRTCARCEIARINRLPVINLVESGGADLPTQADLFVPAGPDLPRPHPAVGARHPDHRARVRQLDRGRRLRARACATTRCSSTSGPRCSSAVRRS